MALLKRDEPTNVIPPAGGTTHTEIRQTERPSWLILLAAAVAILLISTALVFGGRWIYRSIKNEPAKPPAAPPISTPTPTPQPTAPPTNPPTPQPSPPTPTPSPSPGSLPQNGPGEVVTIFIGTSLAAASLHYLVNLRRQKI